MRNNGPAASYEGRFSFQVQSGFIELATVEHPDIGRVTPFLVKAAPPFGPCTTTPYTVTCPYATWFDPGEVRTLHISFLQKVPTDEPNTFSTEEVVGWGVTPLYGRDSNDTNNTAVLNTYFCWPAATDPPGCKTAQPFGR